MAKSYRYSAETTKFTLVWYSWRREKYIYLSAYRDRADKVKYGSAGNINITSNKGIAYEMLFPERARKYRELRMQRWIRHYTRHLPPFPAENGNIIDVRPDTGGLVLVETNHHKWLVGTPSGWIMAPEDYEYLKKIYKKSAWNVLADLGFPVPHRKQSREWNDKLAAYAAIYILGR